MQLAPRRGPLARAQFHDAPPFGVMEYCETDAELKLVTNIQLSSARIAMEVGRLPVATTAGFIGAIGSEKTRADRVERLLEAGVDEASLARLHAPVGVAIGARTPDEVAVSIAAQLIEANVAE